LNIKDDDYQNLQAMIHTILSRLIANGEAKQVVVDGKKTFEFIGPGALNYHKLVRAAVVSGDNSLRTIMTYVKENHGLSGKKNFRKALLEGLKTKKNKNGIYKRNGSGLYELIPKMEAPQK
jgi:hypothetical protein